jgi:DNA/RNA-binding domain of Phe-tRNA-synthetase-like protein
MNDIPSLRYDCGLDPRRVRAALVWGLELEGCPKTLSTPDYLNTLLKRVQAAGERFLSAERKAAVRNMLRFGSYKPAGRSKPSSEYLLSAALEGNFPLVNGPVDVNNAVSLEWGYPASIFDIELCGLELLLRHGVAGESYVFNPSSQSISLEDLLCVCRVEAGGWKPCGNPVKDAMETKINDKTRGVVAVVYAPMTEDRAELDAAARRFAALLQSDCNAAESGRLIVD